MFGIVGPIFVILFLDSVFKGLINMVENVMFHEFKVKENKKYKTIFDSLQEGILIIERSAQQTAASVPTISFCNEIAETIFNHLLGFGDPIEDLGSTQTKQFFQKKLFYEYHSNAFTDC